MHKFRPDPKKNIFVVGSNKADISIQAQQDRSFQFVDELTKLPSFPSFKKILVIGGGFCGCTVAASLLSESKQVTLVERSTSLLSLQNANVTRLLHPTAANWPKTNLQDKTSFTTLNWKAGSSKDVCAQFICQFKEIATSEENNKLYTEYLDHEVYSIQDQGMKNGTTKFNVTIHPTVNQRNSSYQRPTIPGRYDAVVLCVGYSQETLLSPLTHRSYWENSSVIPPEIPPTLAEIGVIGLGDGAILECLLCFFDFQQIFELYQNIADCGENVIDQVKQAENKCPPHDNAELYREIILQEFNGGLLPANHIFQPRLVLFGDSITPYSKTASPLNKLLLCAMLTGKWIEYVHLRVEPDMISFNKDARKFIIKAKDGDQLFDRIVSRIGREPRLPAIIGKTFEKETIDLYLRN